MELPYLSDEQKKDLRTFLEIAQKYNMFGQEGPDRPFWINFRANMRVGEFSNLFNAFCAQRRIDVNNYIKRSRVFDYFLNK